MRSEAAHLRVSAGARRVATQRCAGACEACGLEWPWNLYLFRIDEARPAAAANLQVRCAACSVGQTGALAPLIPERPMRERLREINNRRSGAARLTARRRRALIAERGGRCEICGVPESVRQLDVHHRKGLLQGGDDSLENLMVLCFACHHHLQPCVTGCGRWARKPARICRHCETRRRLELLYPERSWAEIKTQLPALAAGWPPGYEPRTLTLHR